VHTWAREVMVEFARQEPALARCRGGFAR